ncbi:hypothetical protein AAU57_09155 [Nonlabens sp. YIK11]|uniref:hypothetical protein n=1 Tax=Nonlabens sp. YIK11 TaxID=1453349 RepID=UPI0006DCB9C7|nr:hypothetical protein [Nonlabens sp. YIK11]KQC33462.1 hypothetical protein AAU57_09155 [Nonlabens sp. YIK11]
MKVKLTLIIKLLLLILFVSCSSEDNNTNSTNDLNSGEYVVLLPLSIPINSIEFNDEVYVFHNDGLNSDRRDFNDNNISKIDANGQLLWTKELSIDDAPETSFVTISNSQINFFYISIDSELRCLQFDENGNQIAEKLIASNTFGEFYEGESSFYRSRPTQDGLSIEEYTLSGDLVGVNNLDVPFQFPNSKFFIENDKIYVFGLSEFNSNTGRADDPFCKIFENGVLQQEIITRSNERVSIRESLVLDNGNLLFVYSGVIDNRFQYRFQIIDPMSGNEIANQLFAASSNVISTHLNSNGNIVFATGNPRTDSFSKWSQVTILDPELNLISQRILGSFDEGEIFFDIKEESSYYISGTTFGRDGDFELPENTTGVDMFFYKLNK